MITVCFQNVSSAWLIIKRIAIVGILCGGLVSASHGASEPLRITNLAALKQALENEPSLVASVEIEGTVWWSSTADGRIILQDESAVVQLELNLPGRMPVLGEHLRLEGDCLAVKTMEVIKLSGAPVVDNDGIHAFEEKSGTIHLTAGLHPIRVAWFDRTKSVGLEVAYEGPDIPRQIIPGKVLFHPRIDAANATTNYVNGLNYRGYEGRWWRFLPNFDHMIPVQSGVADHFDVAVRSRDNQVGLYFSGFINIPRDGEYTFYVRSDDGSRLFIGKSSLRARTLGHATLPSPRTVDAADVLPEEPEFQWSEVEGTVTSFHRSQGALEVELMTKLGLVRISIAEDSDCSYILMPQNRIRVAGLRRRTQSADRGWIGGEFFVQRWVDVEQLYIAPQIWTEYPLMEIGNLIALERSSVIGAVVHLRGKIVSKDAGPFMLLDDGSDRIVLNEASSETRIGHFSDVLGRLTLEGSNLVLQCVNFRLLGAGEAETDHLPVLTTAERICQLSMEEAAEGHPVRIRGVITSILDYEGGFEGAVIQDASRGIYLNTSDSRIPLKIGDYCEVEGITAPFGFQPDIQVTRLQPLGTSALPNPVRPTWDQLINGTMHCNYVELEGIVASVKDHTIALLTRDGRINVRLNPIGADIPLNALGATVRLRGCLLSDWDVESHQVVVGSIYLDQQKMTVITPAPLNPFVIPTRRVGDLLQFDPQAGALQRVKVSGQLVYQDAQTAYLMDGEHGLRFIPTEAGHLRVGSQLEVVGFLDLSGPSPLLRDAVVQELEPGKRPEPRKLAADALVHDDYDATLVQIKGLLLGVHRSPDGTVLDMQSGAHRFVAMLDNESEEDEFPEPGSTLEITGVYSGQGGNRVLGRSIDSFKLLLDSTQDVRVLSRPPWWTFARLMRMVGLLAGVLLAALIWINLLHRKVEQRTNQLGDQIRQRQLVERQRAIEQERSRLAHDLHDDLGSGLAEVNLLAALASSPATPAEDKARCTDEMNQLLSRMVLSLDEIVWAENPKNDTMASLAGYFGAHAQRLLAMASVSCGLEMAEDLPNHSLDPKLRQELLLAFKEAITNIVKHAKAKKAWLRIAVQDDELVVIVADDGCGILPAEHTEGSDGLVNMHDRMRALGGHCEIQSEPGKGTTVSLRAPIRGTET